MTVLVHIQLVTVFVSVCDHYELVVVSVTLLVHIQLVAMLMMVLVNFQLVAVMVSVIVHIELVLALVAVLVNFQLGAVSTTVLYMNDACSQYSFICLHNYTFYTHTQLHRHTTHTIHASILICFIY